MVATAAAAAADVIDETISLSGDHIVVLVAAANLLSMSKQA
jgi:hypothetical protein